MSANAKTSPGLYGSDPALLSPIAARLLAHGWLKWAITLSASFGALLEVIDTNITNVALPNIRGNLGASLSEAGWVSTAYACANVVIIPLSAWLGMRFGKKNYFVFSLVGFTIASVLCGWAPNLNFLIFARVLQGIAGGGLLAKAQSMVFEAFAPAERGAAQAIFGLGVIAGPAIGPVLGGWLTDTLNWRWIFFINIPFGLFAVLACHTFLPADEPGKLDKTGRVDWTGIGLLAIGLATFQVMLEQGQEDDWFSSRFITLMAVTSLTGVIAFVCWEISAKSPAVDLRVLRHRSMIGGCLYSAIFGMGLYGITFAVPIFVQDYLHYTAEQSGLLQVPGAIASAVAMFTFGAVSKRFDPRMLIAMGALLTTGTGMLLSQINPDTGAATIFWPLILRSLGSVMIFLPLSIATLGPLPTKDIAGASGIYSLTRQLGSSIGVALITTMLDRRQSLHRAILVEKVNLFRTAAVSRIDALASLFPNRAADPIGANHHALGIIDRLVNSQASLLAYADLFSYVAITFVVTLPLILLLGGKQDKKASEAAAAAAH